MGSIRGSHMATDPGQRAQRALRVVRSTSAESLCEELASRVCARWAGPLDGLARIGPFDRVVVAVQGKGLERWMRRRLAQRIGVVGGIDTPYLRRFLFDVAGAVTGDPPPSRDGNDVLELSYRIAQEVADRCEAVAGAAVPHDGRDARAHEGVPRVDPEHVRPLAADAGRAGAHPHAILAAGHRLAGIFDALEVERPELVVAWRAGRPLPQRAPWLVPDSADHARLTALCGWLHRLWWWTAGPGRERGSDAGCWSGHRAWESVRTAIGILSDDGRWRDAQARIESSRAADDRARMPAMVSVFGVSALPPLALDFLAALGTRMDVTLHLVTPTDRYMDEQVMGRPHGAELDEAHLDSLWSRGHRLLAVCGRQPMMMQQRLLSLGATEDVECGSDASSVRGGAAEAGMAHADGGVRDTSLRALQRSLREGEPMDRSARADGSISVHMVSGATRAGEVLRDAVLDAFASLPGTGPDDVLVLTTDVERYGTAIVRALGAASPRPIPVTLADRSVRVERAAVRTYCDALGIADGEMTLEALGEVICSAPLASRAGVPVEACVQCIDLLRDAGGRRFIDAAHRRRVLLAAGGDEAALASMHDEAAVVRNGLHAGVADAPDGTVSDAADRLAMSIAMSHALGGTQVPGIARVCAAIDALLSLFRRTSEVQPLSVWCAWARDLLEATIPRDGRSSDDSDFEAQRAAILQAIDSVDAAARDAGLSQPLPFAAARCEILDAIDGGAVGRRFGMSGGVMVGGLVPMRSVPSRIVALVGLDRGAFPRRDERSGIDPRRWSRGSGDRSARDEDRALFLEAIHAAADRLIVISAAVDPASGKREAASPLVDILMQQCGPAAQVTVHGVHSFGEEEWIAGTARPRRDAHARRCAAARRLGAQPSAPRRVVCAQMRSPVIVAESLLSRVASVDLIADCMRDPSRWWLEGIGARIPSIEADSEEREPFAIDGVSRWAIEHALVERAVAGEGISVESIVTTHVQSGAVPAGAAAEEVADRLRTWLGDVMSSPGFAACPAAPHAWSVDGPGGPLSARGWRSASDPSTQVIFRGGSWKDRHAVEIALRAVAWAAGGGARTVVIPAPARECGMPAVIEWTAPAEAAAAALHEMRRIAAAGLAVPLCIHPMLLADADLAALASGSPDARRAVSRRLDEWLSRPRDDRSRGEVDARAMRALMRGMVAHEVLGPPCDQPVDSQAEARGEAAVAVRPRPHDLVRTDFDGLWPVVVRLLESCGWRARAPARSVP